MILKVFKHGPLMLFLLNKITNSFSNEIYQKKKIKNKIGVVIFGQGWIAIEIIKYILASKNIV